jgi:hypothetical protein
MQPAFFILFLEMKYIYSTLEIIVRRMSVDNYTKIFMNCKIDNYVISKLNSSYAIGGIV